MTRITPEMPLEMVLYTAFQHFACMDRANAAIHVSEPRWSPITFRLMEHLIAVDASNEMLDGVRDVVADWHTYEEDKGR